MNINFIEKVPIFLFNQSVRDLLHYLLDTGTDSKHIIVCDEKKHPKGIIYSDKLYKQIAFGLRFEHLLESIYDTDFITLPQSCTYVSPELLATKTIVITDPQGVCIGIAKSSSLLLEYIHQDEPNVPSASPTFFNSLDFGLIFSDSNGHITSLNHTAKNILHKLDVDSIHKAEDLLPKFDYTELKQQFHLRNQDVYVDVQSFFYTDQGKTKLVIMLFDTSEINSTKKALLKARADFRNLQEIVDNSYDEIYVTDHTGVCIFVNSACERIYGLKREDILRKTSAQMKDDGFISSDLSEKVINAKRRLIEVQTTKIGQKMVVIGSPIFDKKGDVRKVVINSREMADMIDMRIFIDNLSRDNCSNITDRILDLTLESKKIVAESKAMQIVLKQVVQMSQTDASVLIFGETGTGKDVIATLIHEISKRRNKKISRLNCASFSEGQLELEMFGYQKTSMDDPIPFKQGLFTSADKGTIFLDEVDELPLSLQGKLLHTIEDKTYISLGKSVSFNSDFRIIAATTKNLKELVKTGQFREDLYYRLNIMSVNIPPLRERQEDIPVLIQDILHSINKSANTQKSITPQVIDYLKNYSWPGNIRELKNILERLFILAETPIITEKELQMIPEISAIPMHSIGDYRQLIGEEDLPTILEIFERKLLVASMEHCNSTYGMAELLKISQATAARKMQKYGLKF